MMYDLFYINLVLDCLEALPGMPTNLNYVAQTTSVNITWDSHQNVRIIVDFKSTVNLGLVLML